MQNLEERQILIIICILRKFKNTMRTNLNIIIIYKNIMNINKEALEEFNNLIELFMEDMCDSMPNDINIRKYKGMIELANKFTKLKGAEAFGYYVMPYKDRIEACDEGFMLNSNIETELASKNMEYSEYNILEALRFKEHWTNTDMSEHDKACVWGYLHSLIKLYEKIYN